MPLFCAVGKGALNLRGYFARRMRDHARIRLNDDLGIPFLLTGDDVINDHRTTGSDRFLYRCASGFSDEQMAGL